MVNRLDRDDSFEGRVDRAWQLLSHEGKEEFQNTHGDWNNLSDEQRARSLSSYFSSLRQRRDEEIIRRTTEPYTKAIESMASLLDRKFGQLQGQLDQINKANEAVRSDVHELEGRIKERPQITEYSMVGTPTGVQPQINVSTIYPLKMDCRYREKGGPKECIVVETTPEGTYGTCTTGDQVRRMQILPRLFTTAFEKAGCPSNRLVRPCEYYLTKKVRIS